MGGLMHKESFRFLVGLSRKEYGGKQQQPYQMKDNHTGWQQASESIGHGYCFSSNGRFIGRSPLQCGLLQLSLMMFMSHEAIILFVLFFFLKIPRFAMNRKPALKR